LALEKTKIKNLPETIMVGDREHDIIGAQIQKIESIGVLYGFGTKEELEKAYLFKDKIKLDILFWLIFTFDLYSEEFINIRDDFFVDNLHFYRRTLFITDCKPSSGFHCLLSVKVCGADLCGRTQIFLIHARYETTAIKLIRRISRDQSVIPR